VGIQVMFEIRESEMRKGIYLKCWYISGICIIHGYDKKMSEWALSHKNLIFQRVCYSVDDLHLRQQILTHQYFAITATVCAT
jgi:hypothetical protein